MDDLDHALLIQPPNIGTSARLKQTKLSIPVPTRCPESWHFVMLESGRGPPGVAGVWSVSVLAGCCGPNETPTARQGGCKAALHVCS